MEYKGSITVFISMTIVMVISIIFSLVEVVHYSSLDKVTDSISQIGIERAFADYNRVLLEEYGILGVDTGYCKKDMDINKLEIKIQEYVNENANNQGLSFIKTNPVNIEVLEFGLLTDSFGAGFIKQAAREAGYSIPQSLLEELRGTATLIERESESTSSVDELLADSAKTMENMKSEGNDVEETLENNLSKEDRELLKKNGSPLDSVKDWKSKGVLSQVIKDVSAVSNKSILDDLPPSKRMLSNWSSTNLVNVTPLDKTLFSQYLKTRFSSYTHTTERSGLQYEWEYVLSGKESDLKNLESTVERLLATREIANLAYLSKDPAKMSEAESIAIAICVGFAIPAFVEPIKWGIIASWAYLESVLDVRLLLNGGKVPAIKSQANWTSNILLFPNYISTDVMAKDAGVGLSYEDYLMIMTMLLSEKTSGMRALDVIENALHSKEYYSEIKIENFIYSATINFEYESVPVFASLTPMIKGKLSDYKFSNMKALSYI